MSKILFLCMSCRNEMFIKQNETILQTWGKDIIEGKYGDNVQLMFYDGWENNHFYEAETRTIHIRCEDDIDNTYKKTYYVLSVIKNNFDFDYIFRTNTTSYVNVPLILKLIDYIEENNQQEILWCPEVLSLVEANVPFPLTLYGRGNGMILSSKIIDIILKYGISFLYTERVDDVLIGNVLNSYWMIQNKNYLDYIKCYPMGWYKCVEKFNGSHHHKLCEYYNDSDDWNYLKQFGVIQIKQYYSRPNEIANYLELHSLIENKVDDDIDETFNKLLEYSKDPSVFIGSAIGYIDYHAWRGIDKGELWAVECSHKATNDPLKEIFHKDKIWY